MEANMSSKTTDEIKEEIKVLKINLKRNINEFLRANPDLELNIEIEKETFGLINGNAVPTYNPKIEVILK
ncbi:hypothetical protein [Chryseobacterium sp. HR92]|uniref:hypothetical protein n=1 Tax=Chryseobacterium sp. HR92 TaxID=3094839 RepID=UPI0038904A7A|nr:hypothetical protein SFA27_16760 [Chryseobacterium sp. HR92]